MTTSHLFNKLNRVLPSHFKWQLAHGLVTTGLLYLGAIFVNVSSIRPLSIFWLLLLGILILGTLHWWALHLFREKYKFAGDPIAQWLFSISVALLGGTVFTITVTSSGTVNPLYFIGLTPLFIAPFTAVYFFNTHGAIEPEEFKSLQPKRDPYRDPPFINLTRGKYGVMLEFKHDFDESVDNDLPLTPVGADLPYNFSETSLENFFYAILHIYAREFPHRAIRLSYEGPNGKELYRWQFYQQQFLTRKKRFLDPFKTFSENKIQFRWKRIQASGATRRVLIAKIFIKRIKSQNF